MKEGVGKETYNPFARNHGGPWAVERKVGDLGNVEANDLGKAVVKKNDPFLKLSGPFSVVGRVLAVHENPDDLGYGRTPESYMDGCAGAVLASGVILNDN